MPHPTMTARWSHVAVATWAVPAGVVGRYIPASVGAGGIEIDTHAGLMLGDGRAGAGVSVVARSATNVRVMGVRWPRLGGFESVSLRVCVRERESGRRGVVYVREVVSSRVMAWLLRRWYNQPCVTAPMWEEVKQQTLLIGAEYRMQWPTGGLAAGSYVSSMMETTEQMVRVVGTKPAVRGGGKAQMANCKSQMETGARAKKSEISSLKLQSSEGESLESWLTERPFVFGLDRHGAGMVHEVIHPSWGVYPAVDASVRVDFASVFGADLGFLSGMAPAHVMLAVGSEVAMFPARGAKAGVRWGMKRG